MKAVLISIQPKWVEKIASGQKTVEVRKTKPKLATPFKCYIYCTYGNPKDNYCLSKRGRVMCEFVCDTIYPISCYYSDTKARGIYREQPYTCLKDKEMIDYLGNGVEGYGWHITDLVIYDKPKELSEFYARCNIPESKCKLCDNCYDREDCYGRHYAVKKITRPPQSWQYCEVEE